MALKKPILFLLMAAFICSLSPAKAGETRLKRPTYLYGSAEKEGKHSASTRIERANTEVINQDGSVETLFPAVKKEINLVPLSAQKENTVARPLTGKLSQYELGVLKTHDVTILIDKSYSMNTRDCPQVLGAIRVNNRNPGFMDKLLGDPNAFSRWQWTATHAYDFSNQINNVKPDGFKLVLFSSWREIYDNVKPKDVPGIFLGTNIGSGTKTATILGEQLLLYMKERNTPGVIKNPLAIAVVTDGLPDNRDNLKEIIIHITKQMKSPDEISIAFIQIGESGEGREFLQELDNDLTKYGAKYDIVDTKTFDQVKVSGLGRAIVDAITE